MAIARATPTAGVQSQITAIFLRSKGWDFGSPGQTIGHNLISLINRFD